MKYPYHHERRGSAIRFLPLVPVTIHAADDSAELTALVDSGAEENVFRSDAANGLGIDLADGKEVTVYGYDGEEAKAHRLMVDLQLGRSRWRAPVIFSESVSRQGLLGQTGFFAFFTVTFRYSDRLMDIRRAA